MSPKKLVQEQFHPSGGHRSLLGPRGLCFPETFTQWFSKSREEGNKQQQEYNTFLKNPDIALMHSDGSLGNRAVQKGQVQS